MKMHIIERLEKIAKALKTNELIFFRKKGAFYDDFEIFYGEDFNFVAFDFKCKSELENEQKQKQNKNQELWANFKEGDLFFYKEDLKQGFNFAKPFKLKNIELSLQGKKYELILKDTELKGINDFRIKLDELNFINNFLSVKDERLFYYFEFLDNGNFRNSYKEVKRLNFNEALSLAKVDSKTDFTKIQPVAIFDLGVIFNERS